MPIITTSAEMILGFSSIYLNAVVIYFAITIALIGTQWTRKLKKSRPKKKLVKKKINQFHEIFLDQIPFFAISKIAENQFLNWEKV